jgi:hypothetical protein
MSVIHGGSLSQPFNILSGVRQGCSLSPFLFLIAVDWIMERLTQDNRRGIQWTLSSQLEDIDFADDVAHLPYCHNRMQEKKKHQPLTTQTELKINKGKTRVVRINESNNKSIRLEEDLENIDRFIYLGSIISKPRHTNQNRQSISSLEDTKPYMEITYHFKHFGLSPFLFLIAVDWIMERLTQDNRRGIQWTLSSQLEDIDFVDEPTNRSENIQYNCKICSDVCLWNLAHHQIFYPPSSVLT